MKYLLLLALVAVAWFVFKTYTNKARRGEPSSKPRGVEDMVRCAQCGVHLPRSESLMSGQAFYCSPEHRALRERAD